MSVRRLPVRPDLDQLHRQAKELLRDIPPATQPRVGELRGLPPEPIQPTAAKLSDAPPGYRSAWVAPDGHTSGECRFPPAARCTR